jgi:phage replication O-like protein O
MSGVAPPNYTQTPNAFFDEFLKEIDTMAELKVTLAIIRNTFGWKKDEDRISLSQLVEITGMHRETVALGIRAALRRGYVGRRKEGNGYVYGVRVTSPDIRPDASRNIRPTKETEKEKNTLNKLSGPEDPPEEGKRVPWMGVYVREAEEIGVAISDKDRQRLPGNFTKCVMKEGATDQEMRTLIKHMALRRKQSGYPLSPQDALNDIRGVPRKNGHNHPEQPKVRAREI